MSKKTKSVTKASKPVKTAAKVKTTKVVSENVISLKAARAEVKRLLSVVKAEKEASKTARTTARAAAKLAKVAAAAEKEARATARREAAIAKAKAKLDLLLNPVGKDFRKAAQKPSKAVVTAAA